MGGFRKRICSEIHLKDVLFSIMVALSLSSCGGEDDAKHGGDSSYIMERVVLERNEINGENILTQANINTPHTTYVFLHDFVLDNNIIIPEDCCLDFEGGSINGRYTIKGNNTVVSADAVKIFGSETDIAGTWKVSVSYPEWFDLADVRNAIQKAMDFSNHIILNGEYNIQNSAYDPSLDMLAQRALIEDGKEEENFISIGSNKHVEINGRVKALSPLTDLFRIIGNNALLTGGGIIEGCGVVNDTNSDDTSLQWDASLIRIQGGNNRINSLCLYNPTTNCIFIKEKSHYTSIENCLFGGGLEEHGTGTILCGVFNRGDYTIIDNNRFVEYEGKKLYCALFSYDLKGYNTTKPYTFINNYTEDLIDHVVYAYNSNGIIENNRVINCVGIPFQLFGNSNKIVNNDVVWNKDELFDTRFNPNGQTCIITRKGGHYIAGNKVSGITKSFITIDDYSTGIILAGDAENIIIKDNEVNIHYGLYDFTCALNIGAPYEGVLRNLTIEGNVFKGTLGDEYSYCGCIDIGVDGKFDGFIYENIHISNNVFDTLAGKALRFHTTRSDNRKVFRDITIVNNQIVDPLRNASCATNYPMDIRCCDGLKVNGNDIIFTETFDYLNPGRFVSIENSTMAHVYQNRYVPHKDTNSSWVSLENSNNVVVEDNVILSSQNGVATINSGCNTVLVEAPISIYNQYPEAIVELIPMNDNAISLQSSSHYAKVVFRTDRVYGVFNISTNDGSDVQNECVFAYKVKYVV